MISFRRVQSEDATAIYALYDERTFASTRDLVWRACNAYERGQGLGVVVLRKAGIIGFGLVTLWSKVAEISDLIIRADLQGQGYGTQLIHYLSTYASQHRTMLEIGVRDDNPRAHALYKRLGFTYQRTIQLNFAGTPHDIYYLQKQVSSMQNSTDE